MAYLYVEHFETLLLYETVTKYFDEEEKEFEEADKELDMAKKLS